MYIQDRKQSYTEILHPLHTAHHSCARNGAVLRSVVWCFAVLCLSSSETDWVLFQIVRPQLLRFSMHN